MRRSKPFFDRAERSQPRRTKPTAPNEANRGVARTACLSGSRSDRRRRKRGPLVAATVAPRPLAAAPPGQPSCPGHPCRSKPFAPIEATGKMGKAPIEAIRADRSHFSSRQTKPLPSPNEANVGLGDLDRACSRKPSSRAERSHFPLRRTKPLSPAPNEATFSRAERSHFARQEGEWGPGRAGSFAGSLFPSREKRDSIRWVMMIGCAVIVNQGPRPRLAPRDAKSAGATAPCPSS
jgi:hypothetical protein